MADGSSKQLRIIHLQPPNPFDFKTPNDAFEQLCITLAVKEASTSKQVNTLLYCLGAEAESVLKSTNITADERKDYASVLGKSDSFFQMCKYYHWKGVIQSPISTPMESAE